MPARDGADRHARLECLRDDARLVLERPAPAALRCAQNLDPHRPDLMTLMPELRSDPSLRPALPQGGRRRTHTADPGRSGGRATARQTAERAGQAEWLVLIRVRRTPAHVRAARRLNR